jgi:hypothetical protein
MKNAAYAPTKVVQHWYTKAISVEDPWLNAFVIDPGYDIQQPIRVKLIANLCFCSWVQTDMGNRGAASFGQEKAAVTVESSVSGVVKVIDASHLAGYSGKIFVFTGEESPW